MKKESLIVFLMFLVIATPAIAQKELELTLATKEIKILSGDTETVDLIIKNNQNKADIFTISIFPSLSKGVSIFPERNSLTIPAGASSSVKIYFSTPIEASESLQLFSITVTSATNLNISATETIKVNIQKRSPVYISNFTLNKKIFDPGDTLIVNIELKNLASVPSDTYVLETYLENATVNITKFVKEISGIPPRSSTIISETYTFPKNIPPGKYSITSTLISANKIVDKKSADLEVSGIYKLPEKYTEKTRSIGILSVSVKIKIRNEGNIASPEFYVTETIPSFAKNFFRPKLQPTYVNSTDGKIVYTWVISSLGPGEEIEIEYKFELWGVWLTILGIIVVAFVLLRLTLTPRIIKKFKYLRTLEKEILISLEVRNRSLSEIKDVFVKDIVPTPFQLIEKFDTLKPKARKVRNGVELSWNFDVLKGGEERVLTYRIKPTTEIVGSIRLPAAKMEYIDKQKRTTSSEILTLKLR